jgi:hypothetical protein
LLRWGSLVLVLHLGLLLGLAGPLNWQLSSPQTLRTGPMQTRTIAAPAAAATTTVLSSAPVARTRIAVLEKPQPATTSKREALAKAADPKAATEDKATHSNASPEAQQKSEPDADESARLSTPAPAPVQGQGQAAQLDTDSIGEKNLSAAPVSQALGTVAVDAPVTVDTVAPSPHQNMPLTDKATAGTPAPANGPLAPQASAPSNPKVETTQASPNPKQSGARNDAAAKPETPAPDRIANATLALPELALASLPPSALLSYRLSGQEKGINYQASGELRWQRNDSAYAMSLTVKAFLLGSRHWRSVGQINATGLAPSRFSDSWRSERAAHFDRPNQRIVFSSNAPTAPLQPGAQDQVSLYVQLAAAMVQSGQRMTPGTRLQIQTATVRDALPWLLTMEKLETLQIDGQSVQSVKWVCQPRNLFDAQVEFWVSAAHDWLPARIRITQASGSFIDLQLTGREALADLPPVQ